MGIVRYVRRYSCLFIGTTVFSWSVLGTLGPNVATGQLPLERENVFGSPAAETQASEEKAPEVEALTPEATAIADELRRTLGKDSEAIAMLNDILKGSNLGPEDGWFPLAKVENRFAWEYVLKRYDANADASISTEEFQGSEEDFGRLDRDDDGAVTADDFDWSEHSLTPSPGLMMFFMADNDANGKVTKDEFLGLYEQFVAGGDYLAIDDLRSALSQSNSGQRSKRADTPTPSTLVKGLKNQELGSLQPGPRLDELAPDFTLTALDGTEVTLSKVTHEKPTVLIFGNFTCGPFRSQAGNVEKLYERYKQRANFYLIYVREAHPSDGWWMQSNQRAGIDLSQPKENSQRRTVAQTCQKHLELDIPFLVDTVDDHVGSVYSGMPNRLYLIDQQGRIAFKNGRGPFGFHPRQLEQALVLLLNEEADSATESK